MKKSKSVLALTLSLLLCLSLIVPSFASTDNGTGGYATCVSPALSTPQMPIFQTNDYGLSLSVISYAIVTQWDTSGCPLHGQFDGDCTMKALRSTFAEAYNLRSYYDAAHAADTSGNVLYAYYPSYGTLRNLLSADTVRQCQSMLGSYNILKYLQSTADYSRQPAVRSIVDQQLAVFNDYHAANLRRSLVFFFPEVMLKDMNFSQLMDFSEVVLSSRAYALFTNTLHGHDCSTVRSLLSQGYRLDYITQLYTNCAESAVRSIWPDYQTRMNIYRQNHGSW